MKENKKLLQHWKIIAAYLFVYDIFAVNISYFLGLWMRYDFQFSEIEPQYLEAFCKFAPIYTIFCIIVFYWLRLYNSIWRYASFDELNRIVLSSVITGIFHIVGITVFFERMPFSYYVIGMILQFLCIVGVSFGYRYISMQRAKRIHNDKFVRNAMIIGAGEAGRIIIRELLSSPNLKSKPVCIIDDNKNKWNRYIEGVPVVGGRDDILYNVKKYNIEKILFAIPTATLDERREILNICKETGCELKQLPGVYQLVNGEINLGSMKDVAVEDLLGREQIKVNLDEILGYIKDKTVLVTGGGGSIGSELCRQIAAHDPKRLIIFDIYENNAYDIEQELKRKYPELDLVALIGSVRDSRRVNTVFETYKPDVVYHAAAHKHVPLMETSPGEAIKNNVIGTYKTAYAAMKNNCQRFVLISTDKAVNPTNIMGASKRMCEMVIQGLNEIARNGKESTLPLFKQHKFEHDNEGRGSLFKIENETSKTEFVAVRFGNVLGSNGSVIPLFKKQIASGGPVTVTHPDIIRYFMTIPEAVSLVLQAGAYAKGGEIFVLDMGAPVKIDTLARNLIKLSGFKPDEEIQVVYSGLRPGEKLYEEKLMEEEGLGKTENELIHIGKPIPFDTDEFFEQLGVLAKKCYEGTNDIKETVEKMVPTYHPEQQGLLDKETFEQLNREMGEEV